MRLRLLIGLPIGIVLLAVLAGGLFIVHARPLAADCRAAARQVRTADVPTSALFDIELGRKDHALFSAPRWKCVFHLPQARRYVLTLRFDGTLESAQDESYRSSRAG